MALVRSVCVKEDASQDQLEYYRDRIISARKMKNILEARVYLSKAIRHTRPFSMHGNLTRNLTQLELGLMEAINSYQKVAMERQLLNTALQKSIQSTLLYMSGKNFFNNTNLNYVEYFVGQQMKRMLLLSDSLPQLKEETDEQYMKILSLRKKQISLYGDNYKKIQETEKTTTEDDTADLKIRLQKKIDQINLVALLISLIIGHNLGHPKSRDLILLALKWRTRRTFEYYKKKCNVERESWWARFLPTKFWLILHSGQSQITTKFFHFFKIYNILK